MIFIKVLRSVGFRGTQSSQERFVVLWAVHNAAIYPRPCSWFLSRLSFLLCRFLPPIIFSGRLSVFQILLSGTLLILLRSISSLRFVLILVLLTVPKILVVLMFSVLFFWCIFWMLFQNCWTIWPPLASCMHWIHHTGCRSWLERLF